MRKNKKFLTIILNIDIINRKKRFVAKERSEKSWEK